MQYLIDLIKWFFTGSQPVQTEAVPAMAEIEEKAAEPVRKNSDFDIRREAESRNFLGDLQNLKPVTRQFEQAREDLVNELKKLAPPKRARRPKQDAA